MNAQLLVAAALLLTGTGAVILLVRRIAARRVCEVRTKLVCPATGRAVEVVAVQERDSGLYTGIRGCTAFGRAEDVLCSQTCVKALNALASADLARPAEES